MRSLAILVAVFCLVGGPSLTVAQEMFSGAGIRTTPDQSGGGGGLGNWFQFGRNRPSNSKQNSDEPAYRMPWGTHEQKPAESEKPSGVGLFGLPRPNLMPERDPEATGFFETANQRSKDFFQRTGSGISHWATRTGESIKTTNQHIRTSTTETWESITRSLPPPPWSRAEKKPNPLKPPLRSPDNWMNKDRD